ERSLQDLFEKAGGTEKLSWFSNNSERTNISAEDFRNEILSVEYSQNQLTPSQVLMKANQIFSHERDVSKQLVYISDFQQMEAFPEIPDDLTVNSVQLNPVKKDNVVMDSLFFVSKDAATTQLKIMVSKQGDVNSEVPISLFNNGKLIAKT